MAIKGTRVKQMKEGGVPCEPHKAGKGGCRGWGGTAAEKGMQGGNFNKAQGLSPPSCLGSIARCRGRRWLGVGGAFLHPVSPMLRVDRGAEVSAHSQHEPIPGAWDPSGALREASWLAAPDLSEDHGQEGFLVFPKPRESREPASISSQGLRGVQKTVTVGRKSCSGARYKGCWESLRSREAASRVPL